MPTVQPKPCCNCGKRPEFRPSDDPEFAVLLAHDSRQSPTCPADYALLVYHDSEEKAIKVWNEERQKVRRF